MDMTVLDDRELGTEWYAMAVSSSRTRFGAVGGLSPTAQGRCDPVSLRCTTGGGVAVSQAVHRRRPVSTGVTAALAGAAALITLWLGSLAHLSGHESAAPPSSPDRLAVVQVQAGETLQQLAGRVAPDAPVGQVVDRIRDLNHLESAMVDAGQTLVAPIG